MNHIENNVAIIVANIPILRGLVTRWVFNFRTKATPMERDFRSDWQWSTSTSSTVTRVASRRTKFLHKIIPCIDTDFSSSLARSNEHTDLVKPARIAPAVLHKRRSSLKCRSRKQSRRNSIDRYEEANCLEKGDVLERVTSVGSLESDPTLIGSPKEVEWRFSEATMMSAPRRTSETTLISNHRRASEATFMSSPRRVSGATLGPPLSPISPLGPVLLREVEDEDEILRYP